MGLSIRQCQASNTTFGRPRARASRPKLSELVIHWTPPLTSADRYGVVFYHDSSQKSEMQGNAILDIGATRDGLATAAHDSECCISTEDKRFDGLNEDRHVFRGPRLEDACRQQIDIQTRLGIDGLLAIDY
ncbi:hypothetical protein DL768_007854 [Monosporascus sp. mg162]|nr:hypothetical protein DL768_007854 [Monosporascus sp. mg162]